MFKRKHAVITVLAWFAAVLSSDATVTLTSATGGTNISADSTGGSFSAVTGPIIAEGSPRDITPGTIILTAPAGFVFDAAAAVTISISGTGTGVDVVLASSSATVDSTNITVTVIAGVHLHESPV